MFGNLLRTDFKRSLMTKKFAILVIGMILVELLSCGRSLLVNQFGVTELMDNLLSVRKVNVLEKAAVKSE